MALLDKAPDKQATGSQNGNSHPELKTGWVGPERLPVGAGCGLRVQPGFDWTAFDAYLFDIDGTLLNSRDAVHYHAFHHAVKEVFGLDLCLDGVPVHGSTDVGILRSYMETVGVPEREWLPKVPEVIAKMNAEVERNAGDLRPETCPSIPELIKDLAKRGKLLGVASGNIERAGWAKLKACGLREYFRFGSFSGEREKRADVIAHGISQARSLLHRGDASAVVVGDTPADIHAAHANKIPAIAVATGIYSLEELWKHSPEMCVACCDELLPRS
ncbi:MAG TPA: HAD family hydrolase [Terriglobales bacterium]|nr:HAD family hydrolase [Terriglobales bacterium]